MFNIVSILPPLPRLKIVDIGAMLVGKGDVAYSKLSKTLPCEIIGFEPNAAECDKLTRMHHEGHRYLPYFIGDGAPHTFYECNFPMTSSLFEPNAPLLAKFQNLEILMQVVKTYTVETRRLDDVVETVGVDFLKIDVRVARCSCCQALQSV